MSKRPTLFRLAAAVLAIVASTTLTFAATGWTDLSSLLTAYWTTTSASNGAATLKSLNAIVQPSDMRWMPNLVGPLNGTYNIPGDYADLGAAITALNANGVSGPVTLNIVTANPQVAPDRTAPDGGTRRRD